MPGDRYFGARDGAGPAVVMRGSGPRISPGALGTTVLVGAFRSGPLDELVELTGGQDQFRQVFGRPSPLILGAMYAEDFYALADGAGTLHALRVAASDARAASRPVYSREAYGSILSRSPHRPAYAAGTISAHNVGRWGGRSARVGGVTGTWDSATRFEPAFAVVENEWIGSTFRALDSSTGLVFETKITGNDATGFDLAGPAPSTLSGGSMSYWYTDLDDYDAALDAYERVEVSCVDDTDDLGSQFGVRVNRDGAAILDVDGLFVDPAEVRWDAQLDAVADNYVIDVTRATYEGDASASAALPADYAEVVKAVSGATITFQTVRWTRTSTGGGNAYLETDLDWTEATVKPRCRARYTLTFTTSTAYTVSMEMDGYPAISIGTGATGTQFNSAAHPLLPRWTVRAGSSAMSAGNTIVIDWRPVPAIPTGSPVYLYPAATSAQGDALLRYRVSSVTSTTVTVLGTSSLSSVCIPPTAPTLTGPTAGPYSLAGSDTFIYTLTGRTAITLTSTLGAGSKTTTQTVAELNALELARAGSAAAKLVAFEVATGDKVKVSSLRDLGSAASITIGAGTLNSLIGLAENDTDGGADGTISRLEGLFPLMGGADGTYVANADVVPAFQDGSLLDDLDTEPVGLVRVMAPGFAASAAVANAMTAWAYEHNAQAFIEIPTSVTSEAGAIAHVRDNLTTGDVLLHAAVYWPSAGYHAPSLPGYQAELLTYWTGAILGVAARVARDSAGYVQPPAGDTARLDTLYTRKLVERVSTETLGKFGINPVITQNRQIKIYGARVPAAGRPFLTVRAARMHIARALLNGTGALVFQTINDSYLGDAKRVVAALFNQWFLDRWFDDADGPLFTDQVTIKADRSNNPQAQRELGNAYVDIEFRIAGFSERFISRVGPKGLSTQF